MSQFKPYPAYKDSGVEWLGEVPGHWVACKLNFRYSIELGKMLDEKKLTSTNLIPYLRNQDVQWGRINTQDLPEMDIYPGERERYTIKDGDLLVCEGGDVGRAAIWRGENSVFGYQKALHRLRHRSSHMDAAEFFYFSLLTAKQRGIFEESDNKATIAHLPAEKFRQYRFAFPPLSEQRDIAVYLQHETARIDTLIEEQQRLIELLKEKRAALVLSSINMPESYEIRMQHAVCVISRPVYQQEDETYTPIGLFNRGRGLFKKEPCAMAYMGDSDFFWIKEGDLILSGQFAWEGAVAMAGRDEEGCVVSHRYPVLRGRAGMVRTEYLFALLATKHGDFLLNESSRGAAGRNRPLNISALLKEKIKIPPLTVQDEIVAIVRSEKQIRNEVAVQEKFLQERRSALISAAVTGKIDVRGWQPPVRVSSPAKECEAV